MAAFGIDEIEARPPSDPSQVFEGLRNNRQNRLDRLVSVVYNMTIK